MGDLGCRRSRSERGTGAEVGGLRRHGEVETGCRGGGGLMSELGGNVVVKAVAE